MKMRLLHSTSIVILTLLMCGVGSVVAQTPPTTGGRQLRMFSRTEMWSPVAIASSSLTFWLDASDSSTIQLSGSNVVQWNDKSGNNRNATPIVPATVSTRPTYSYTGFFGRGGITFDGVDDNLLVTGINAQIANVTHGVYWVYRRIGGSSASVDTWDPSIGVFPSDGSSNLGALHYVRKDNSRGASYPYYSSTPIGSYDAPATVLYDNATGYVMSFQANGTGWGVWNNGTLEGTTTNLATPNAANAGFSLARQVNPNRFFNGTFAEVLVVQNVDATMRQRIEGYLAWKWGLQANLPAAHPWRNSPPLAATLANTSLTLEIPASTTSYSLNVTSAQPERNAVSYQDGDQNPPLLRWTNGSVSNGDVFRMSDGNPPVPGWFSRSSGLWYTQGGNPAAGGTYTSSGDLGAAPDGGSSWLGTVDANDLNIVTGNVQRAEVSSDGMISLGSSLLVNPDAAGTSLVSLTSSGGSISAAVRNLVLRSPNFATMNTFPHSLGTLNPDSNTVVGAQTITSTTYPLRSLGNSVLGARALQPGLLAGRGGATVSNMRPFPGIANTLVGNSV
ncbi:MAG TPA: hypothetical protein DCZ59_02830, partial [Bacteroidetes bacterium]|nr:hypothetical protein [Bacteroidota bacterium]